MFKWLPNIYIDGDFNVRLWFTRSGAAILQATSSLETVTTVIRCPSYNEETKWPPLQCVDDKDPTETNLIR